MHCLHSVWYLAEVMFRTGHSYYASHSLYLLINYFSGYVNNIHCQWDVFWRWVFSDYSCSSQYLVCLVKPGSSPDLFPVRAFTRTRTRTFVIIPIDTKRYYTLYTTSHKLTRSYRGVTQWDWFVFHPRHEGIRQQWTEMTTVSVEKFCAWNIFAFSWKL